MSFAAMLRMEFQHKDLAAGRWAQMSLAEQMLNIGSEVSRANRWKAKGNEEQCHRAADRALELVSLTIDAHKNRPGSKGIVPPLRGDGRLLLRQELLSNRGKYPAAVF